jgi:hypothetical protein
LLTLQYYALVPALSPVAPLVKDLWIFIAQGLEPVSFYSMFELKLCFPLWVLYCLDLIAHGVGACILLQYVLTKTMFSLMGFLLFSIFIAQRSEPESLQI